MEKVVKSIRTVRESEKSSWDKLAMHPLQSWAWGQFRQLTGVTTVRLGVYAGQSLISGWQITFHHIPFSPFTVGYFPKGPAIDRFMADQLLEYGRKQKAIYIQIEPNVDTREKSHLPKVPQLKPSHHPLFTKYTYVLDLDKSEEQLLAQMHPKTRYNIRLAQKHGVVVKEDSSPEAISAYLALTEETTNRQKFYAHTGIYHQLMWQVMSQAGVAHLFTATYKQKILAAWIAFVWKDSIYYPYGSSSRDFREVMAPNLMLWEIARWAKKRGLNKFDLWGALGPSASWRTNDPWYGFHRFKEGYRPRLVEFIGSYDLVIRPFWYRLYTLTDNLRWVILKTLK